MWNRSLQIAVFDMIYLPSGSKLVQAMGHWKYCVIQLRLAKRLKQTKKSSTTIIWKHLILFDMWIVITNALSCNYDLRMRCILILLGTIIQNQAPTKPTTILAQAKAQPGRTITTLMLWYISPFTNLSINVFFAGILVCRCSSNSLPDKATRPTTNAW